MHSLIGSALSLFLIILAVGSFTSHALAQGVELIPRDKNVLGEITQSEPKDDFSIIESLINQTGSDFQTNIIDSGINFLNLEIDNAQSSAKFVVKAKFRTLFKKSYKAVEKVDVIVDNARTEDIEVTVFDPDGEEANFDKKILSRQFPFVLQINPPKNNFKPGKYRVAVREANGEVSAQDFLWGVLAINTNKAIYLPGEVAQLSIAVLDETGMMVCDANVKLEIRNPKLETEILSTENGKIKVNEECRLKAYTEKPDYEANFHIPAVGDYNLNLSATTKNGTYSITSGFEVKESVAFDMERKSATRIYPVEKYPVNISITANEDFEGTVEEIVPGFFEIYPSTGLVGLEKEGGSEASVLGENTFDASSSAKPRESENTGSSALESDQKDTSFVIEEYSKDKGLIIKAPLHLGLPFKGDWDISQMFGVEETDPLLAKKYNDYGVIGHDGIDFKTPLGTQIIAVDDGKIVRAREKYDYGTTIIIEHSWGKSYYGHLSELKVREGDSVKKGAVIGLSGNTGLSTGPHLHFGVKLNENDTNNGYYGKINPMPYLGYSLVSLNNKYSQVLGSSTNQNTITGYKKIVWKVSLKKGEKITLNYIYKAPQISPQFYLLGPVVLKSQEGRVVFNEGRRWQIAVDAAPTIRASTTQDNGNDVTHVGNRPTGTTDGDLLLGFIYLSGNDSTTGPSGWTRIGTDTTNAGTLSMWWKVASSEPTSWSWTTSTNNRSTVHVLAIQGAEGTAPAASPTPTTGTSQNPDPPASGTVTSNDYLAIAVAAIEAKAQSFTPPSGYTEETDAGTDVTSSAGPAGQHGAMSTAYRTLTAATAEDPGTFTAAASNAWLAATLLIAPAGGGGGGGETPTNEQLMRHGKWFNNGVEQPFTF